MLLPPEETRRRSRYLSLLQIGAALNVVAVHIGLPYSNSAWMALDLFFVLAGMNMVRALRGDDQSFPSYAVSRVQRLGPEMLLMWCIAVIFVLSGSGSPGIVWFIASSPLFLHNFTRPFFDYIGPREWIFAPLWFVGALVQLQLLAFVARKWILQVRPEILMVGSVWIAIVLRALFAALFGQNPGSLPLREAETLYLLPTTHLEAFVLGLLIGRGALPKIARLLPVFCLLAISLVVINVVLAHEGIRAAVQSAIGLGFEYPLRGHYAHVWGYTVVAFVAASLASPNGRLAVAIERWRLPVWADRAVFTLAPLTYGAYVFHGIILATGVNAAALLTRPHASGLRLVLFAITVAQAFLIAWLFQRAMVGIKKRATGWRFPGPFLPPQGRRATFP